MKRLKWYLVLAWLSMVGVCNAQSTISTANGQLRTLFENIPHPSNVNFCYDMCCHVIDSAYYDINSPLITDANIWFYLYEELYNAAFDQSVLQLADSVVLQANRYFSDTIPFGFIDYRFVHFPKNILEIDLSKYYICDEVNGCLYGLNDNMDLLKQGEVYMASALQTSTKTLSPTFAIDFDFIFADEDFTKEKTYWECIIDFGDGSGAHSIKADTMICISFPKPGEYFIHSTIKLDGVEKTSISRIEVRDIYKPIEATYYEDSSRVEGLRTFRFDTDCTNGTDKFIFVLAGYNPKSFVNSGIRTAEELYTKYVLNAGLEVLKEFGYSFIIVDYEDHNANIEYNALRVAKLLSWYRCCMKGEEQFVVIGHSMGCLVGRYALTYLEKHPSRFNDCHIEKLHNTRLFISNDGPHQGVNIPLSLQCLYGAILDNNPVTDSFIKTLNAIARMNLNFSTTLLHGNSVKQMLYYHYETDVTKQGHYEAHSMHTKFLNDLRKLGDYPQYCKLVALSNGSITGEVQQNYYSDSYAGQSRVPGDKIFDFGAGFMITILGMRFDETFFLDLFTNSSNAELGFVDVTKSFSLVGLLSGYIYFSTTMSHSHKSFANQTNLKPYCVNAGGNEYAYSFGMDIDYSPFFLWVPLLGSGVIMEKEPGCFVLSTYVGLPWVLNGSAGFGFCSDGLGFGFVPTESAFDYRYPIDPENTNYATLSKDFLFANTPFDAIIGRVNGKGIDREMLYFANFNHEEVNNPILQDASGNIEYKLIHKNRRLLACEIGDEELYLNNFVQPYRADYSAVLDIIVKRDNSLITNPYFESELGVAGNQCAVPGAYMRNESWEYTASLAPYFHSRNSIQLDQNDIAHKWDSDVTIPCVSKNEMPSFRQSQNEENEEEMFVEYDLYTIGGMFVGSFEFMQSIFQPTIILPKGIYIAYPKGEKTKPIKFVQF